MGSAVKLLIDGRILIKIVGLLDGDVTEVAGTRPIDNVGFDSHENSNALCGKLNRTVWIDPFWRELSPYSWGNMRVGLMCVCEREREGLHMWKLGKDDEPFGTQ